MTPYVPKTPCSTGDVAIQAIGVVCHPAMGRVYDLRQWRDQCAPFVLADEPWCRFCLALGCLTPATVVDHIVPARLNPDLAFERSNLQALCKAHHDSAKQQQECRGYHGELDAQGYPIDPAHPANRPRGGGCTLDAAAMTTARWPTSERNG